MARPVQRTGFHFLPSKETTRSYILSEDSWEMEGEASATSNLKVIP